MTASATARALAAATAAVGSAEAVTRRVRNGGVPAGLNDHESTSAAASAPSEGSFAAAKPTSAADSSPSLREGDGEEATRNDRGSPATVAGPCFLRGPSGSMVLCSPSWPNSLQHPNTPFID